MLKPYHKYVFNLKKRKFVGKFEEMYRDEDKKNYDSWLQENATYLGKQVSLAILSRYNFSSILDIGCGKGVFTHFLKKENNSVVGTDISGTAVKKARSKYENLKFVKATAQESLRSGKWELIVMMEILSYLPDWKAIISKTAKRAKYLYISLYLPPDPIGYVKSFQELKKVLREYYNIETELLWNNEHIFILCQKKGGKQ